MATLTQIQPPQVHTVVSGEKEERRSCISQNHDIPLPPPAKKPIRILDIDKATPDSHVQRDPRLIRLTGVHPFNVEAPLTTLYDEGFLTSPELFFVRNHGAVPKVFDEQIPNWELSIDGLVDFPLVLNFKQILSEFEQITAPITLVCAGNRRKEQNQVRKSNGFSWGAAGVSTALFTGPLMSSILKRAKPSRRAKYVCMEGADKLPNGNYGTSIKMSWAMDPNRGIMLAHKMNGESLRPDHGRPLRAVVPGQIGGRSVKWLTKLIVTEAPSDNWYHIYDNRVLPTMVSPELASREPKWWHDERYAIHDLSVNSVTVYPKHNETIQLSSTSAYEVRGYAYSGGGRRISRVEISLDKGATWQLANVEYPEDKYRNTERSLYGGRMDMAWRDTSFCWSFWNISIRISDLEAADSILVRAMDESMNIQPRDMYWSVLGMMNNLWFRIKITKEYGKLTFEHPNQPALIPGGWMDKVKKAGGNLLDANWGETTEVTLTSSTPVATPVISMKKPGLKHHITLDEFRKHKSAAEPWFVVEGEVYDGTDFLEKHPGGAQSIISPAGTDCTEEFMAIHSEIAKAMMKDYHLGTLEESSLQALKTDSNTAEEELSPSRDEFLVPNLWAKAKLSRKESISPDTCLFSFALDYETQKFGLPVGQHVMLKVKSDNKSIIRAYTPISEPYAQGTVHVLVKIYNPTPEYPAGGNMTVAMDRLDLGTSVEFKGPIGKFQYLGRGKVKVISEERHVQKFYMICAGSGVTPIFQVLRAVMQDDRDTTRCTILDGNRCETDILCRPEFDSLAALDEGRCEIVHTLTRPSETWTGRKGRISEDLLKQYVVPHSRSMVLICGPGSLERSVHQMLVVQGWSESDMLSF